MFKKLENLEWGDLISEKFKWSEISYNDCLYRQDELMLIRLPQIKKVLNISDIHVNDFHKFFIIELPNKNKNKKRLLKNVYNSFKMLKNFAIRFDTKFVEITTKPKFIDENFETFRNRCLFELRDELDISHWGKGKDSIMLPSKYTSSKFKLKQKGTL